MEIETMTEKQKATFFSPLVKEEIFDKLEEELLEVPRQMPLAPVSEEVIEMVKQENNDKGEYNMKQFNFQIHVVTVSNFLMRWVPITNMKPVGQRPAVEDPIIMDTRGTNPSKAQSIIQVMLEGYDIGEIKIAIKHDGLWVQESIDGGNRKRDIVHFVNNEFATHPSFKLNGKPCGGMYFKDLPKEVRDYFMRYNLTLKTYNDMDNFNVGKQFRVTNTSTAVPFICEMNSYGDIPIANMLRELVKTVDGKPKTTPHDIFETYTANDGSTKVKYIEWNNKDFKHLLNVARLAVMIENDSYVTSESAIIELYTREWMEKDVTKLRKKIEGYLDIIFELSKARKTVLGNKLTEREFVCLSRLIAYLKKEYGSFSIPDYVEFWKAFYDSYSAFDPINPKMNTFAVDRYTDSKGERRVCDAFKGYLWNHIDEDKINQSLDWLLRSFKEITKIPFSSIITVKDKKRLFTKSENEVQLSRQGYVCYIDELPLTLEDGIGAHISPHCQGHPTTPFNHAVVREIHNTNMGSTNADVYKTIWQAENDAK